MKTVLIFLTLLLTGSVLIYSCKHDPIPFDPGTGGGTGGGGGTGSNDLCFESEVLPIFKSHCAKAGCHDAITHKEGYILDSYENIVRKDISPGHATSSKIYKVLFETGKDRMPEPPNPALSNSQKEIIGIWINEGAKNTINCSSGCDTTKFTFSAYINPILQNNCVGCHNAATANGGVNLSNYINVKVNADNGKIYGAVAHLPGFKPMPQGGSQLSACNIRIIQKWIKSGALNN